ncbi:MAG: hypothetical protein HKO59_06100 [Phycisphaerales bacterium]|nr:hypothetical protein [Phycisphaerae bacterium]NNF43374.1 hypothetical protein [Phycisphaerales bacterium]NNM25545.1 hypothetical protein [Phycisphaerales bacterium]
MRQGNYLNGILTVNALLLAGLLWTQVADAPALAADAVAGPPVRNPLDAGAQRQRMIDSINTMNRSLDGSLRELTRTVGKMNQTLTSGRLRVEVSNSHEIRGEAAPKRRVRVRDE